MTIAASVAAFNQIQKNKKQIEKEVSEYSRKNKYPTIKPVPKVQQKPFNFLEYAKNNPGFLELLRK